MYCNNLFDGINSISDPNNPTDLEKRHLPGVNSPDTVELGKSFLVTVKVGDLLPHPNAASHFIEVLELYADETFLASVKFTAGTSHPATSLQVALAKPAKQLRAVAKCNLHGAWLGSKPIEVTGMYVANEAAPCRNTAMGVRPQQR